MKKTETIKIAILFQGSVLMPTASANRVKAYTEGLLSNNCAVRTFNMHPVIKEGTGDFDSRFIDHYDFNIIEKESGTVKRKYYYLKYLIKKTGELKKYSHILFYGESHIIMLFLFAISRLLKIKLIFEGCEYPIPLIKNRKIKKIYNLISVNVLYKIFHAGIVVSDNLYNYYKEKGRKDIKLIKIPIMVDPARFENIIDLNIPLPKDYIAYCGNMSGDKDGIPVLLKSMSIITKRFPGLKLLLIGDNKNQKSFNPVLKLISDLNLDDKIIFTGIVEKKNIPYYLSKARALVLSRPDNFQAKGGFPTKLGEYLSSGRPTVVTKVGEIAEYLTDGVTAFLVEAGSHENFAQKVLEVLENTSLSSVVAINGKKLAGEKFDINTQGQRLAQFICSDFSCCC